MEKFQFYLEQDNLFLREYCRFLGLATAKSDTLELMGWFADLINETLRNEMGMHMRLASMMGLTESESLPEKPTPTTQSYTSYLLKVASLGTLGEIVAVMTPCPWSYLEIFEEMKTSKGLENNEVFKELCSFYTSIESRDAVQKLKDILDRLGGEAANTERVRMKTHFLTASQYEYLFWDMAYNMK